MDFASTSVRFSAPVVLMSGLRAPGRMAMAIPDRAIGVRVLAATLPCAITSSITVGVSTARSNGSPLSIFRFSDAAVPYWITTVCRVVRSNWGTSSSRTPFKAVEDNTRTSVVWAPPV